MPPNIEVSEKRFTHEQMAGVARTVFLSWPKSDLGMVCDLVRLIEEKAGDEPRFSSREDFDRNEIEIRIRRDLLADVVQLRVLPLWGIYDRSQARQLSRALIDYASAERAQKVTQQKVSAQIVSAELVSAGQHKRSA